MLFLPLFLTEKEKHLMKKGLPPVYKHGSNVKFDSLCCFKYHFKNHHTKEQVTFTKGLVSQAFFVLLLLFFLLSWHSIPKLQTTRPGWQIGNKTLALTLASHKQCLVSLYSNGFFFLSFFVKKGFHYSGLKLQPSDIRHWEDTRLVHRKGTPLKCCRQRRPPPPPTTRGQCSTRQNETWLGTMDKEAESWRKV